MHYPHLDFEEQRLSGAFIRPSSANAIPIGGRLGRRSSRMFIMPLSGTNACRRAG